MPAQDVRRAIPVEPQVINAPPHIEPAVPHPILAAPGPGTQAQGAQQAVGAMGLGELQQAKAAATPAAAAQPAGPAQNAPQLSEEEKRELVTHGMETLKESKHILRPGDKGEDVALLQRQMKQLGLHVKETGVMDKDTQGYIKAIQTGGGLRADGVVGPKTIDQLLTLDKVPQKPKSEGDANKEPGKGDDNVDHMPDDPKLAAIYLYNRMRVHNAKEELSKEQEKDMETFIKNWDKNKSRYEKVAGDSGVPAKLIAALHWRESTGDFGTYLHQGDPLGKKAVNEPADIPIFKEWEPAANHALGLKKSIKSAYKIDENTTDEVALASYAERYNGTGYFDYHAMATPYVMAGTDQYKKGKYRSDGGPGWDPNYKDTQLGVLPMLRHIDQHEKELAAKAAAAAAKQPAAPKPAASPNQHFAE